MNPNDLIDVLGIKSWNPRIGDFVRRRDTKTVIGSIESFEHNQTGFWANCTLINGERRSNSRMLVGLLEPIDVLDIIRANEGLLCRALERMVEVTNV